jgi:5-methylcytosine-specific restriction endonuclease McrA
MKTKERLIARELRQKKGMSLRNICKKLNIAKSTARAWTKDIKITEKQKENLRKNVTNSQFTTKIQDKDLFVCPCYVNRKCIKKRILKKALIPYICALCSRPPIWEGQKLVLILDHINGNNLDYRLSNIRFLCPNCNSQQETFCRNKKVKNV